MILIAGDPKSELIWRYFDLVEAETGRVLDGEWITRVDTDAGFYESYLRGEDGLPRLDAAGTDAVRRLRHVPLRLVPREHPR